MELTGANSYTGDMFIGGELLASADCNLGAPTGDMTFSNGTLLLGSPFDLAAGRRLVMNLGFGVIDTNGHDMTVRSAITGNASFVKDGLGTLTLVGPNTFTGRTILAQGAIENRSELVINQQTDGAMAQSIDGAGILTKRGVGRLDLTGTSTMTGNSFVRDGNLAVNGSILAG
ncbi:autotransporter-associated beta strand repeat-containing protein [Microvirga rosea]|nr:autotransporter-associated beta strand repeat-containing protein [Microvirga rosea]